MLRPPFTMKKSNEIIHAKLKEGHDHPCVKKIQYNCLTLTSMQYLEAKIENVKYKQHKMKDGGSFWFHNAKN